MRAWDEKDQFEYPFRCFLHLRAACHNQHLFGDEFRKTNLLFGDEFRKTNLLFGDEFRKTNLPS
jgi:hypothetical protein